VRKKTIASDFVCPAADTYLFVHPDRIAGWVGLGCKDSVGA